MSKRDDSDALNNENIQSEVSRLKKRPINRFPVPRRMQQTDGVTSFGLVTLTMMDERRVAKLGGDDSQTQIQQQAIASLREVNGKAVSEADGTAEQALNAMHPKTRLLVSAAFNDLHGHRKDDLEDFLKGREEAVG